MMSLEGAVFLTAAGILFTLDIISTAYILTHRNGTEANPVVRLLIEKLGMRLALILSKVVALVILVLVALYAPVWAMWAILALYVWVVAHNARQLL